MCVNRQEEERRRREEEMLRQREMEEQMRRQREEKFRMGNFMDNVSKAATAAKSASSRQSVLSLTGQRLQSG